MLNTLQNTLNNLKEFALSATSLNIGFFAFPEGTSPFTYCLQNLAFIIAITSGLLGIYRVIKKEREERRQKKFNAEINYKDRYTDAT